MYKKELICTIGPGCDSKDTLTALRDVGVNIFRINMSHASVDDLIKYKKLSTELGIRLGIDTEGAQIRTKITNSKSINLEKKNIVTLSRYIDKLDNSVHISLHPENVFDELSLGNLVRLDFNGALVRVDKITDDFIYCECISSGLVSNNKGVDIVNDIINLPDFTKKDIKALQLANDLEIREVFISFCKSKDAILKAKEIVSNSRIISKIESKLSIHNLPQICEISDAILIDRGDLTREINIMDIPFAQRGIVRVATANNTPCYVATNVLESLIEGNLPTRAELNDIVGTLEMGASGIVLAAETAIGKKPVLCAEIARELIHRFELYKGGLLFADIERNEITDNDMRLWLNR